MRRLSKNTSIAAGAILLASVLSPCYTQKPITGQISGHVADPMGAEIPNSLVFLREYSGHPDNVNFVAHIVGHTDGRGNFQLVLPEGIYDILITAAGFASELQTVPVNAGKTSKAEWKLKILGCDFPNVVCDDFGPSDPAKLPATIDRDPPIPVN